MAVMTDEDQELFLQMLLQLDETHESIKAASKWCRANAACDEEIVRMWFFAVAKAQSHSQRLYLFHLASDILFTAEPSSVHYFSSFLPQIFKAVPFVRGEEIRTEMMKLFSIWRDKKIYNKVVMKQLTRSLKNRNKMVDMAIFKYDKDLLFKNLKRVGDLKPACDYLSRGVEFSPSFDNSQAMLSTIKERKSCQALLASVDSHKTKVMSLVSYMEEMVHLLKMATTAMDLAGNKELNGIEETKIRILAYGKYREDVKGVLSALEKKWELTRGDYAKPITPASPEPEEDNLYSRRVVTGGVPGDPRLAGVLPPVPIPSVPLVSATTPVDPANPANWALKNKTEDIFHRRERSGSINARQEEVWPPAVEGIPFTNPEPPSLMSDNLLFVPPRPRVTRDMPFASPRAAVADTRVAHRMSSVRTRGTPWTPRSRPANDEPLRDDWDPPRYKRMRDEAWKSQMRGVDDPWETSEDPWDTPRRPAVRDEPWDTPRRQAVRDEPWDTPRRQAARDEPWDTPRRQAVRDEPWDTPRRLAAREPRPPLLQTPREKPLDTPRPHSSREEPWERSYRDASTSDMVRERPKARTPSRDNAWEAGRRRTPSRDESWERPRQPTPSRDEPWTPESPLYTGATTWGPPLKKPVYMPCYTGFHLDDTPSDTTDGFKAPLRPVGDSRSASRLGEGSRAGILPHPTPSQLPSLLSRKIVKKPPLNR